MSCTFIVCWKPWHGPIMTTHLTTVKNVTEFVVDLGDDNGGTLLGVIEWDDDDDQLSWVQP